MKGTVGISSVLFLYGWHQLEMAEFQSLLLPGPMRQHLVIFQEIILQEFLPEALYLPHYHMYIHLKRGTSLYLGLENSNNFNGHHELNRNDVLNFSLFFKTKNSDPKLMLMIFESIVLTDLTCLSCAPFCKGHFLFSNTFAVNLGSARIFDCSSHT